MRKKRNGIVIICLGVMILFCLVIVFDKIKLLQGLDLKIVRYQSKKKALELKKKQLEEELLSSHEEAWIEKALIEELGVIPEGAVKLNYIEDQ